MTSITSSKKSNISKPKQIDWNSPVSALFSKKNTISDDLTRIGFSDIKSLLWIFPLRVEQIPPITSFLKIEDGRYFRGIGKVINIQKKPNFYAKGKGKALLYNVSCFVKDQYSNEILTLRWFNSYSSTFAKLETSPYLYFLGEVSIFQGQKQIVNPQIETITDPENITSASGDKFSHQLLIQYPTINKISPTNIRKVFDKIPKKLWDNLPESIPQHLIKKRNLMEIGQAFKCIHGQCEHEEYTESYLNRSKQRLIYEELFLEQCKIFLRREATVKTPATPIVIPDLLFEKINTLFPHELTTDQKTVLSEIRNDLSQDHPMMRLVQGDVGCGKTWVAFASSMIAMSNHFQVALLAPTESLATQHYNEAKTLFGEKTKIEILVGSTKPKIKKEIYEKLKNGEINLIIGTHALIQESVEFKKLGLAIIDEQHKFGVDQRIKLTNKGKGVHCLIMTATPIPRSLSLTQYGDLDISSIRTMPKGRIGIKTRIVETINFEKYLQFLGARMSLKEQIYVVVPAINENPKHDLQHVQKVFDEYRQYFPSKKIATLHGEMKDTEKSDTFKSFVDKEIDLLIATSVIEVGINNPNATVMSILNPERFGLSSLHQLRGRVGRGGLPGFCFLVVEKELSQVGMQRLSVIEKTTDGFEIAEEDLKIRGEGDIFGTDQSGKETTRKISNIVINQTELGWSRTDLEECINSRPPEFLKLLENLKSDLHIFTTI